MTPELQKALDQKLGKYDTAYNSNRFTGRTFDEFLTYLSNNATVRTALTLGGVGAEELLAFFRDPNGKVLDADRVGGRTFDDLIYEVKQRIKEASHPYVVIPVSLGGWSRLVTIPATYTSQFEKRQTIDEDLLFVIIGGGPYGFLAERPVAYLRIGREGRPPVINVLSGRYTIDFFYRKVQVDGVTHTEIWCGEAARNDFQIVLLGGDRGCVFGHAERAVEEKPEGTLVAIRQESVVHQSYMDKTMDFIKTEIAQIKSEIAALQK